MTLTFLYCLDAQDGTEIRTSVTAEHSSWLAEQTLDLRTYGAIRLPQTGEVVGSIFTIVGEPADVLKTFERDPFHLKGVWQSMSAYAYSPSSNSAVPVHPREEEA